MAYKRINNISEQEIQARLFNIDTQLLGQRIKLEREENNLTLEILSARVGCSSQYLRAIELGAYRPTYGMLQTLALSLNKPISFFLRNTEAAERELAEVR